jgi:hypothetical protein
MNIEQHQYLDRDGDPSVALKARGSDYPEGVYHFSYMTDYANPQGFYTLEWTEPMTVDEFGDGSRAFYPGSPYPGLYGQQLPLVDLDLSRKTLEAHLGKPNNP